MKTCPCCHRMFADSNDFCPDCGAALTAAAPAAGRPIENEPSKPQPAWLGLVLGIASVLVAWEVSGILGVILAGLAIVAAIKSSTGGYKVGAITLSVITILMFLSCL